MIAIAFLILKEIQIIPSLNMAYPKVFRTKMWNTMSFQSDIATLAKVVCDLTSFTEFHYTIAVRV